MDPVAAQSLAVKRAQVEFHKFASLGEPERNLRIYAEENARRATVIRNHREFIGEMTPFLEIGANAGHSSYMLVNEFGADGFALDLSADSLRHGRALMDAWRLDRAPVRVAGDAVRLPFADASLRFVVTFQTLSQFMNLEAVFCEVARVLQPGGVFLFAEEPLLRKLSLRLYRCPYQDAMKPWERRLYEWGLLGYLVRDVIGAYQEESFGIRQNHTMGLAEWDALVRKYFADPRYQVFVPERGWGERVVKRAAGSEWRAARWLGGTLAAVCRKPGSAGLAPAGGGFPPVRILRCPDCGAGFRQVQATLQCTACSFEAADEGGVYNLLPSAERRELYPGDRDDIADFSLPSHASRLVGEWYHLEGVHGNKYRWMGERAALRLKRVASGPQRLRIRGHAPSQFIPGEIRIAINGAPLRNFPLDRPGLFVLEADLPHAPCYDIEIQASHTFTVPTDDRVFSVSLSMVRLIEAAAC